jgi:hypothetical protein
MKFDFENETVDQISSKLIEYFEIDVENDNVSSLLSKMGFEIKNNYLSEETSSIVYYSPVKKVPDFNNGLGIVINKRYFDLTNDDNENTMLLRDAFRFLSKQNFDEASTNINLRRVYEEETTYKVAQNLLNQIKEAKKTSKKIVKLFVNK